jgi:hypothetical protein
MGLIKKANELNIQTKIKGLILWATRYGQNHNGIIGSQAFVVRF